MPSDDDHDHDACADYDDDHERRSGFAGRRHRCCPSVGSAG
jgi:hypothetical protein